MKKIIYACIGIWMLSFLPLVAQASTSAAVTEAAYETWKQENYGDFVQAPVSIEESGLSINGTTGRGSLYETDLSLPGKNGLDVNITRVYNSMPEVTYDVSTTASSTSMRVLRMRYKNEDGETRYVDYLSEDEYLKGDKNGIYVWFETSQTLYRNIKRNGGTHVVRDTSYTPQWVTVYFDEKRVYFDWDLNGGVKLIDNWNISLPKLTTIYSVRGDMTDAVSMRELHFPDGRTYSLRQEHSADRSTNTLTAYRGRFVDSIEFKIVSPQTGDINGDKTDTEKGISYTYIFQDSEGKRYYFTADGNLVYEEDRFGNAIKYRYFIDGFEITDTMGRIIRYTSVNSGETLGKLSVTVDGITRDVVYYEYEKESTDSFAYNDRHLLKVKKPENGESASECVNVTTYEMGKRTNLYSYSSTEDYKYAFPVLALLKIEKPNGSSTSFTYSTHTRSFADTEYIVTGSKDMEDGAYRNKWTYSYPKTNTFQKVRQDGYTEKIRYDTSKRLAQIDKEGDGIFTQERYVYDENRAGASVPSDKIYHIYKQVFRTPETDMYDYIEISTNYERDDRENIIYENYMTQKVVYDYGTAETNPYNIMLSKVYENEGVQTKVENTLTADFKAIAESNVYVMENGTFVKKSTTSYTYDSFGNVIKKVVQPVGGSADETNFVYTYTGAAVSVESYKVNEAGERVSTVERYDAFGCLIEETDANGNKTTYTYDTLLRPTTITYCDGTVRSYTYNVVNNSVTAVNENGVTIRQTYNLYGQEKKTEVKNTEGTFVVLQEKTYSANEGQLASVTEQGPGNRRVKTEYTWDDAGNVTQKVTKHENANGSFSEVDRVTATYTTPEETGTRIRRSGTTVQSTKLITTWNGGDKYVRNEEWTRTTKKFILNGSYDYVLVNLRGIVHPKIYLYTDGERVEFEYKGKINNDLESPYYRSYIIDVAGVDEIRVMATDSESGMRVYDFRAYTQEDIDALITKVETTQTGDSTITPPKSETHIDIWGNQVYNKLTDTSSGTVLLEESRYFDDLGNELSYRNPVSYDLGQNTVSRTYNHLGQVTSETTKDSTLGDTTVTASYDNIGRLTSETDANGNTTSYTYDKLGRVIRKTYPVDDTHTAEIRYTYDKNGNVTKEEVKNGNAYDVVEYAYDGKNRVVRMTTYPEANKPQITQYYYDGMGNVLRVYMGLSAPLTIHGLDTVTANGDSDYHVTKYTYNFMGYPVKMTDSLGQEETYTVDYLGNILSKTDRNGDTVTTTYNYRGQPLTVTSSKDNKIVTYTYDRLGNRKSMTDETGTTNYTYSNLSHLLSETKDGVTKTYTYDKNGTKTGFTLTDNGTSRLANTYTVTNAGVLTAAQSGTDSVAYTYDNNRNMLTETVNGTLSQTNLYNKANQATSVQNKNGTATQSQFTYTYSENGNMSAVFENLGTMQAREFFYDGMGRLTEEILGTDSLNYAYDDFSNRTSLSREGGTTNYVYDANNRLTTRTAGNTENLFNYDNNGNLFSTLTSTTGTAGAENETLSETASDADGLYTFDGLGRLTGLEKDGKTISYTYNGDGQRVSKTVDGVTTQYVWDGDYIVMEKTGNSTTVYKRGNRLFANEKDGIKTFYRYNARGDVVQLTNASYAVTKTYRYDAFGNEQNIDANDTNPFRYCGEYYDTETGYIYLRARYYDPIIGRFISEDPIRDGLNWYVYCGNNPVMFFDPLGLAITDEDRAAFARGDMTQRDWDLLIQADAEWNSANKFDYSAKAAARAKAFYARSSYTGKYVDDEFDYTFGTGYSALDQGQNGKYVKTTIGQSTNGRAIAVTFIYYERYAFGSGSRLQLHYGEGMGIGSEKYRISPASISYRFGAPKGLSTDIIEGKTSGSYFSKNVRGLEHVTDEGGQYLTLGLNATFNFSYTGGMFSISVINNVYDSIYIDEKGVQHGGIPDINYSLDGRFLDNVFNRYGNAR